MRILIYGLGGVGGYFGGKLTQTRHEVVFIARGSHLQAIKSKGLKVSSIEGGFTGNPHLATDNVTQAGKVDLILLAVKSWQLEAVAATLKPVLKPETAILPLQNGADNADKLRKILPQKHILEGLCRIVSFVAAPGHVKHTAFKPEIRFGEPDNRISARVKKIKQTFDEAGFYSIISKDITVDIWRKFLFICTISGIGALTRSAMGVIRQDEVIRKMMLDTANEILAVAKAKGVALGSKDVEQTMKIIDKQAPHVTASMQRDIMQGKPSELHTFNGYIVSEGQRLSIPVPVNKMTYHCLLPMENTARKDIGG